MSVNQHNFDDVISLLPHRPPMLLVDTITELKSGSFCRVVKNTRSEEFYFQGHFPHNPIMPGCTIVEAMAQAAGLMLLGKEEKDDTSNTGDELLGSVLLLRIKNASFNKVVKPGDALIIEVSLKRRLGKMAEVEAAAYVETEKAASAELVLALQSQF